jgi:hypothetical protein
MPLPTCGLKLLAHAALSYYCTRPDAIGSYGLKVIRCSATKLRLFFFELQATPPPFFFPRAGLSASVLHAATKLRHVECWGGLP